MAYECHEDFSVAPWEAVRKQTQRAFLTEDILENLFQMHVTVEDLEQNNKINYCKLLKLNEKDSVVLKRHTSKVTKLFVLMCNPS